MQSPKASESESDDSSEVPDEDADARENDDVQHPSIIPPTSSRVFANIASNSVALAKRVSQPVLRKRTK